MPNKPKVLIIAPEYPFPPDDGHKLRNFNIFRHFSTEYDLSMLTFGDKIDINNRERLITNLGSCFKSIEIIPKDTLKKVSLTFFERITNVFMPFELTIEPYYSEKMHQTVKRKILSLSYDLVYFSGLSMFVYKTNNIPIPYIIDIIDSVSLNKKNNIKMKRNPIEKSKAFLDYIWARNYEKIYLAKAKNMLFVSSLDRDYVNKNSSASKTWVIPNGVDTEYFISTRNPLPSDNTLLFTGAMSYPPNNDAMVFFMQKILPLIRYEIKNVYLVIAGKDPTSELQHMVDNDARIRLTGYVNDMRPYFEHATVCIAPIISGSGIKNKILEAWAMSKPVVTTPVGCHGIVDAIDGYNVLIADNAKVFAEKVSTLLRNPKLRDKLSKNGRRTVEKSYSWIAKSSALEKICLEVLNNKA